jgi:glyoxalase family protein
MALEGLHHITAITADAPRNVDFYARVLGLRLVKKTVNFDAPDVYHLYYGDERGTPGSILTFFEFPGAIIGRAGAGMAHTIQWRIAGSEAVDFWADRLGAHSVAFERGETWLRCADFEGLAHELLAIEEAEDAPLSATAADVPAEHALQGFEGIRAYAATASDSARLLRKLGFERTGGGYAEWRCTGLERHALLTYDDRPPEPGRQGAGTVHHVAWSAADDTELATLREHAADGGARPTPIIDRQYFHSVYFREPSGVLFEVASRDIGFTYDEPLESLGEALRLPPQHEHLREHLERTLAPLPNPRQRLAR